MRRVICDIETNGLLPELDRIWIAVTQDLDEDKPRIWSTNCEADGDIDDFVEYLKTVDELIGHNFINFDIPAIRKVTGYHHTGKVTDTLILSKLLHFTRYRPVGYPTGHSLGAWGAKLGVAKPDQEQWTRWETNMITRCVEDVRINVEVYNKLMVERDQQDGIDRAIRAEHDTARICSEMTFNGWLLDMAKVDENIEYLDKEIERLRLSVEPLIPKVVKLKDGKATWEEVNKKLNGVWKKVPRAKLNHLGKPVKVAAMPSQPKILKSGKLDRWTALWFGISAVDPMRGSKSLMSGGPYTRISFEQVRLSQHTLVKEFLLKEGWVPTQYNFRKCPKTGKTMRDDRNKPIPTTPILTEDSYETIKGETGKNIGLHATLVHRRNTLANPKNDEKGWKNVVWNDGRLRCDMDTLGAATGRMAHKVLTNVPGTRSVFGKEMRQCFVAPEGRVLIGADAAGCQLRLLAGLMGDEDYITTVVDGIEEDDDGNYVGSDVHTINGLSTGLIAQSDHEWLLKNNHSDSAWHTYRDRVTGARGRAKNFIYGLLFGAGDAKIGLLVDGTSKDGKRLKENFFNSWPKLRSVVDGLLDEWRTNKEKYKEGWITGCDGRRLYVESEHKCLNYKLQGDEAVLMKYVLNKADRLIKKNRVDSKWLLIYHDEVECEINPKHLPKAEKILIHSFVKTGEELGLKCPMATSPKVGNTWYDIH